jgi:hypothetical protein
MAETYRARIPLESLDPLAIGASDDESKIYREELESPVTGPAKVIALPFARYQLPRNMVRLEAEPLRFPQEAHA